MANSGEMRRPWDCVEKQLCRIVLRTWVDREDQEERHREQKDV